MHVVVCGGGVIGACTAYFLARRGVDATIVERTEVAAVASGKAGGFIALDWCSGSPLDALARRSFALHTSLDAEIGDEWGFQNTNAYSGVVALERNKSRHTGAKLDWLSDRVSITSQLGTNKTTAVVNPRSFTLAMMRAAQERGATLRLGEVTGIVHRAQGAILEGVQVGRDFIAADAVVIAMGPWSLLAAEWVRLPAVVGQRSPSLVYDTGKEVAADALFLECDEEGGGAVTVEVFPRGDGTTHVCAFSDQASLPTDPADVTPDADVIERLETICERLSPAFRAEKIIARQACFRPLIRDGLPLIGKVPHSEGAFVATGHNVWGILNGPATGEAMAELVSEGMTETIDLAPFDPGRLRPLDSALIRSA